jgi:hypothetical protein
LKVSFVVFEIYFQYNTREYAHYIVMYIRLASLDKFSELTNIFMLINPNGDGQFLSTDIIDKILNESYICRQLYLHIRQTVEVN